MLATTRTWFNDLHINTQLMILITALNFVDFQTTKILVDKLGFVAEGNPLLLWAMVTMGSVYAILLVKIVVLAVMWWIYDEVEHHHKIINPTRMTGALSILVAVFFALITWNFFRVGQELSII